MPERRLAAPVAAYAWRERHKGGDEAPAKALAPGLRLQELQELPHQSLGSMRMERCDQPGLMSDRPPFMG